MDVMKYKTIDIKIEETTKNRDALLFDQRDAGWKWCGLAENDNPEEETLKFEKKFPVGDVVRGMVRSVKELYDPPLCNICLEEYHPPECPVPAFLEAFDGET